MHVNASKISVFLYSQKSRNISGEYSHDPEGVLLFMCMYWRAFMHMDIVTHSSPGYMLSIRTVSTSVSQAQNSHSILGILRRHRSAWLMTSQWVLFARDIDLCLSGLKKTIVWYLSKNMLQYQGAFIR